MKNEFRYDILIKKFFYSKDLDKRIRLIKQLKPYLSIIFDVKFDKTIFNNKLTYFTPQEGCNLVYEFLKENYKEKSYIFSNVMANDLKILFLNEQEKLKMIELIKKLFIEYLKKYDFATAIILLKRENTNRIMSIYINSFLNDITNDFKVSKWIPESIKKTMLIKYVNEYNSKSSIYNCVFLDGTMNIKVTNDVYMVASILHEFIHKDNITDYSTNLLVELPSIILEGEFVKWLFDNECINQDDYNCFLQKRLQSTYSSACYLKIYEIIVDVYDKYKNLDINLIIKKIKQLNIPYFDKIINSYSFEFEEKFSYFISDFIGSYINDLVIKRPFYREKIMEVNDNLFKKNYKELLELLDLPNDLGIWHDLIIPTFCEKYEMFYKKGMTK